MRASIATALATGFASVLLAVLNSAALAASVGDVEAVQQSAFGTPPNAGKEVKRKGDDIAYRELLETLPQSGLLVRFSDGSKLTLGASSRLLVDDFVYDPADTKSKALVSIPAGTLRYVTGAMPKGQTTIDTPTATMVLRGTNVTVGVARNGDTQLYVKEGRVSVHNKVTGADTEVDSGNGVDISSSGFSDSAGDQTGDPAVDDGIAGGNTPPKNKVPPEQRRSGGNTHSSPNSGHSNSPGGGNSSGGNSSGGNSSGGGTQGG
jgi:hypothetical protein